MRTLCMPREKLTSTKSTKTITEANTTPTTNLMIISPALPSRMSTTTKSTLRTYVRTRNTMNKIIDMPSVIPFSKVPSRSDLMEMELWWWKKITASLWTTRTKQISLILWQAMLWLTKSIKLAMTVVYTRIINKRASCIDTKGMPRLRMEIKTMRGSVITGRPVKVINGYNSSLVSITDKCKSTRLRVETRVCSRGMWMVKLGMLRGVAAIVAVNN